MSQGLTPLPPEVIAKRKRQNRILVALLLLIAVPIAVIMGTTKYTTYEANEWGKGPIFLFDEPTKFYLDPTQEDHIIWVTVIGAECEVSFDGVPVPVFFDEDNYGVAGLLYAGTFEVREEGSYEVLCTSSHPDGIGRIGTKPPFAFLGLMLVLGYGIALASGVSGLVMLILGIITNTAEKNPPQPRHPSGSAPPTMPGVPPWPPRR
ncbi:MAG: hypothetical protein LBG99_08405 [Propionibacteriaceae bacterium]|jgi:hypothetical protein|nr:hypothetical protein [Propionibacteriaceae bacterium]